MSDKLLDDMSDAGGGGSSAGLTDRKIQQKLGNLYAQHEAPKVDDSFERTRARNTAIRIARGLAPRGNGESGRTFHACTKCFRKLHYEEEQTSGVCYPCAKK
jgi:hypothetical protein